MNYDEAKQLQVTLKEEVNAAYAALHKFPSGMFGGTTAQFRDTLEYNEAAVAYHQAYLKERTSNEWFAKTFKKQIAAEVTK